MTLEKALETLIQQEGKDVLRDSFRSKCVLSDLVKEDRYERKILLLFLQINAEFDLYASFSTQGLAATRAALKPLFPKYRTEWAWEEFRDAVNALAAVVCPKEYLAAKKQKEEKEQPKQKHQAGQGIVVGKKKQHPVPPSPTPVPPPAPKPKPKGPSLSDLSGIDAIEITAKDASVHLKRDLKGPYFLLRVGKKQIPFGSNNAKVSGKTLKLDLSTYPYPLTLVCGKKHYRKIVVKAKDGDVTFDDRFEADETLVVTENGFVVGELGGEKATIRTDFGFVDVETYLDELIVESKFGDVNIDDTFNNADKRTYAVTLDMGSVTLKTGKKLHPRPTKLLGKSRRVWGSFSADDGTTYNLAFQTNNGTVKVR